MKSMEILRKVIFIAAFNLMPAISLAHTGNLDSNGGHVNINTGEYHCHEDNCKLPVNVGTIHGKAITGDNRSVSNTSSDSTLGLEINNSYVAYRLKTFEMQEKYLSSLIEHQKKIMRDTEEKLLQQKWQTIGIAIVVFIMVIMGVYLSYAQFKRDQKEDSTSSITLKIGAGSVDIASPVIGLAILALSFWFFQSYIEHVYSVNSFSIPPIDLTTFGVGR